MQVTLFSVFQHLLAVQHQCQLTASEPVKVRNFKLADKRNAIIFRQVTFNLQSAYGVGAVQYDEFFTVFGSSLHGQAHRADIGKGAATDVLNVIHQYVHIPEHVRSSLAGLSV